jgi:hypothetical protein
MVKRSEFAGKSETDNLRRLKLTKKVERTRGGREVVLQWTITSDFRKKTIIFCLFWKRLSEGELVGLLEETNGEIVASVCLLEKRVDSELVH